MKYETIDPLLKAEAKLVQKDGDSESLSKAAISVALYEEDLGFAQRYCLELAIHPDPNVRGNAILGFGHLARRFRTLDAAAVAPLVKDALVDSHEYVRGHASAAAEDINHFIGIEFAGASGDA